MGDVLKELLEISDNSSLSRAQKLQENAAKLGFDWPHIRFVLEKLQEEIKEFEVALRENKLNEAREELGDILFVCANLARHIQSDAEAIMGAANLKFEKRFQGVKRKVQRSGKSWETCSLKELEKFWQEVKEENKRP